MAVFSGDAIGVDFGTDSIAILLPGEGVVLREASSVLSLKADEQQVLAVGDEARAMQGRTAEETVLGAPVQDGAMADVEMAALLLLSVCERATGRRKPLEKYRLFLNMPFGLTKVEKQALEQTARLAGSKKCVLVKAPLAAALGAGLPADQPKATMIVSLGAGTTQIAVISMGGIVAARSMRGGTLSMDEAIVRYVRKKKGLVIGPRTAEDLKIDIGSATLPDYDADGEEPFDCEQTHENPPDGVENDAEDEAEAATEPGGEPEPKPEPKQPEHEGEKVLLKGRDAKSGLPKTVEVSTRDIALALKEPISVLLDAMRDALQRTPEELAADVLEQGIQLTGGGALLFGLPQALSDATGVPVRVSEHPRDDVLLGLERLIDDNHLCKLCSDALSVEA